MKFISGLPRFGRADPQAGVRTLSGLTEPGVPDPKLGSNRPGTHVQREDRGNGCSRVLEEEDHTKLRHHISMLSLISFDVMEQLPFLSRWNLGRKIVFTL
ncbi:hypothetical protein SUGI_1029230 [Cryptomeria japonica]|nr:hypothetical protein SUGI_1029230 [Cryptomeria japonica]